MSQATIELLADSSQIKTATKDLNSLNAAGLSAEKAQKGIQSAAKSSGNAMGQFSRKAGAAGIQIQQFTGQVTTGTNGLIALSQQAADLGIVLGAPLLGVIASLGATALLMASDTDEAKDALGQLDEIAETVGNTLEQAANGSDIFSESIQRLASRSEALARVQIAQTISELNKQIATSAKGIKQAVDELDGVKLGVGLVDTLQELGLQLEDVPRLFGDISSEVDTLGAGGVLKVRGLTERIDLLASSLGISKEQAVSLQVAMDDFAGDQSATGIARLRGEVESLNDAVGSDNEKVTAFSASLLEFFDSSRVGVDRINLLRQALSDFDGTLEENSGNADDAAESTAKLTTSMQAQIIALESGAQAAEVYAVTQRAIADGTQEQLPSLIALINRKYELKGAQEAAAQAAKEEAAAMSQLESDYQSFLTTYERYEASRLNQLKGAASGTSGLTNLQSLEQQYEAEKALLQAAQDEGIASKISYEERLTELQRQYAEKRNQIIKGEVNSQSFLTQATQDSLGVLSESFGNMASIAQSGGEDSFETYKAFASAQAVVSGILAAQNTLATASQFYPSPIPEGMALAVAGLAAVNVAQIQSQTYSPRAVGGSVYGDNSYLVGERGPELFTPNSSGGGRITPFNQLMNQAGQQNNTTNETTNLNLNISGLYETPADMIIANRDLIIGLVADYKRRRGEAF
jgi:chromosome segregation ATPase